MEKLDNDPTVLVWCGWEEGGSHHLETEWSLRGNTGRESELQRERPDEVVLEKSKNGQEVGVTPAQLSRKGQGRDQFRREGLSLIPETSELRK